MLRISIEGMASPLRPIETSLLIALCAGPGHGYELVGRIHDETGGRLEVLPGNLYVVIKRLRDRDWVAPCPPPDDETDPRRRYFRLTDAGRERLEVEIDTWDHQLRIARKRLAASSPLTENEA